MVPCRLITLRKKPLPIVWKQLVYRTLICRTMALVVRAGDPFQFPVSYAHSLNSETIDTDDWYVTPLRDTYYAIAISDERAARRIANHLDQLPIRCGASTRRGLSGQALQEWLDEFATLAAISANHIDWRAIEIKDLL